MSCSPLMISIAAGVMPASAPSTSTVAPGGAVFNDTTPQSGVSVTASAWRSLAPATSSSRAAAR